MCKESNSAHEWWSSEENEPLFKNIGFYTCWVFWLQGTLNLIQFPCHFISLFTLPRFPEVKEKKKKTLQETCQWLAADLLTLQNEFRTITAKCESMLRIGLMAGGARLNPALYKDKHAAEREAGVSGQTGWPNLTQRWRQIWGVLRKQGKYILLKSSTEGKTSKTAAWRNGFSWQLEVETHMMKMLP